MSAAARPLCRDRIDDAEKRIGVERRNDGSYGRVSGIKIHSAPWLELTEAGCEGAQLQRCVQTVFFEAVMSPKSLSVMMD
jgi:hypothetical protein